MQWGLLNKKNGRAMIADELHPIHEQLKTHSTILEDYVEYKKFQEEHNRRSDDKEKLFIKELSEILVAMKETFEVAKKSAEFDEKNAENLQVVADIFTSIKTGRQSMPFVSSIVGFVVIIGVSVAIAYEYFKTTILTLLG